MCRSLPFAFISARTRWTDHVCLSKNSPRLKSSTAVQRVRPSLSFTHPQALSSLNSPIEWSKHCKSERSSFVDICQFLSFFQICWNSAMHCSLLRIPWWRSAREMCDECSTGLRKIDLIHCSFVHLDESHRFENEEMLKGNTRFLFRHSSESLSFSLNGYPPSQHVFDMIWKDFVHHRRSNSSAHSMSLTREWIFASGNSAVNSSVASPSRFSSILNCELFLTRVSLMLTT